MDDRRHGHSSFPSQESQVRLATSIVSSDSTAPVVSATASGGITATSATVTWTTSEISNSQVEYGLTTSIFTSDITSVMRFVDEVETGMVHVNEPTVGGEAQLPFGGTKSTGVGEREMAEEGLNFFTELKTVFINYSGKAERSMTR